MRNELNTEFLLDFNCELNKKSRDDWKLLSSDHRHNARRSSHVTVDAITSICNAFDSKGFLLSVVEKTKESARRGFRIIMKLSVARTLSFYISNDERKDE